MLLKYSNATDFSILNLILQFYWIQFWVSTIFLVNSLGVLYIISYHLQILFCFFPIWMDFISYSCLIALTRTSNTMLNKSGEIGHPSLVPDLWESLRFSLLTEMLNVDLSFMAFFMLRYVSSIATFWEFSLNHKWMLNFVKAFSAPIEMIICFILLMWSITLADLQMYFNFWRIIYQIYNSRLVGFFL